MISKAIQSETDFPEQTYDEDKASSKQLADMAKLHQLAGAKITFSFSLGDASVESLGGAILAVSASIQELEKQSAECSDLVALKTLVKRHCDTMNHQSNEAVTALQFYDLLSQQMEKVRAALNDLGGLLTERSTQFSNQRWAQQLESTNLNLTGESGGKTVSAENSEDLELFMVASAGAKLKTESTCELF